MNTRSREIVSGGMRTIALALLYTLAACSAPTDDDATGGGGDSGTTGAMVVGDSGSDDHGATSTSGPPAGDSSSDESSTGEAECLVMATGHPCADVLGLLDLCAGDEACALVLSRLFGSPHDAGDEAIACQAGSCDACEAMSGKTGCVLTVESTAADCAAIVEDVCDGPEPVTCEGLEDGAIMSACVAVIDGA